VRAKDHEHTVSSRAKRAREEQELSVDEIRHCVTGQRLGVAAGSCRTRAKAGLRQTETDNSAGGAYGAMWKS
jgi:hypothetical protein